MTGGWTPNRQWIVAVAAPAVVLAWLLVTASPKLIFWPDSTAYLGPALDAIERGHFTHWNGRTFGYSLSLLGWLQVSPEPTTIVFAQRVMVAVTFTAIAATIVMLGHAVARARPATTRLIPVAAAFWLMVFALYPPVVGLAHLVMPEVLFSLVLALMIAAVAWLSIAPSPRQAASAAACAAFTSTLVYIVKPHWMFAALAIPLLLPAIAPSGRRPIVAATVVAAVAISWVVLLRPEVQLQQQYDSYASRVYGPRSLFCNSADLVHGYLAARPGSVDARIEDSLARILTDEARRRAIGWDLVGFDGDACMHGETGRLLREMYADRPSEETAFYTQTYVSALSERPWYLVARIARHFRALAMKPFNAVSSEYFLRADTVALSANQAVSPMLQRWLSEQPAFFTGLVDLPTRRMMLALRWFFGIAGVLLTAGTIVSIGIVLSGGRGIGALTVARSFGALLLAAFLLNFLIAGAGTLEPRLVVMQMPLLVVLGFTTSMICAAGFQDYRLHRHG